MHETRTRNTVLYRAIQTRTTALLPLTATVILKKSMENDITQGVMLVDPHWAMIKKMVSKSVYSTTTRAADKMGGHKMEFQASTKVNTNSCLDMVRPKQTEGMLYTDTQSNTTVICQLLYTGIS